MNSVQYTIRAVPPKLDRALRTKARQTGKSLNQTMLEALGNGLGIKSEPKVHHDMDWFVGSMSLDPEFDKAMEWLDSLPKDMD